MRENGVLGRAVFELRRSFKKSYKPAPNQKQREEKRERKKKTDRIFITLSTLLVGVSLASDGLQSGLTSFLDLIGGKGFTETYKATISWIIFLAVIFVFWVFWRKAVNANKS